MPDPGDTIGPYTISGELGRGGMGVVYRATDPRLGRDVAIKSLPEDVASDPSRLARFDREAKTLASLSHPNLAGIHGIEETPVEQGGARYLVLELIEGQTLADLLEPGALPPDEAIRYALQICAGLAAAHEAGVVHRDLKPDNVKITPEGRAKILDFGLAKADEHTSTGSALSITPTATSPNASPTVPGAIMGTAPYMSPEQARGRSVDRRTDVWAFGVVLYEMLTGVCPFKGDTATDSIGAILHKDIDFSLLPPSTPQAARRVLERCLERDKDCRYRDLADVAIELQREDPLATSESGRTPINALLAVACVLLLATVGLGVLLLPRLNEPAQPLVASLSTPKGVEFSLGMADPGVARLSPDGTMLAYCGVDARRVLRLYIKDLSTGRTRTLQDTEGAQYPFWSPDSRSIAFFQRNAGLMRIAVAGGPPRRLADGANGKGGAWNDNGTIVFSPGPTGQLRFVPAEGGETTGFGAFSADEGDYSHRHPQFLPDDQTVIYTRRSADSLNNAAKPEIWARAAGDETGKKITESDANAFFARGHLFYVYDGTLLARPFDPRGLRFTGEPVAIADNIMVLNGARLAAFSVNRLGQLTFLQGDTLSERSRLVYRDRQGEELEVLLPEVQSRGFRLADNATKLLIDVLSNSGAGDETRLIDLETGDYRVVENDIPSSSLPVITRDGSTVAFWSRALPDSLVYTQPTSGFVGPTRVASIPFGISLDAFSHDNSKLFFSGFDTAGDQSYIGSIPLDGSNGYTELSAPCADIILTVQPSPDGRWVALIGSASDSNANVFLAPSDNLELCRRIPMSVSSITPRWSADSAEIFVHGLDDQIYSIPVSTLDNGLPEVGRPTPLFDARVSANLGGTYDAHPSGEKFLIAEPLDTASVQTITYMTDWQASLKR